MTIAYLDYNATAPVRPEVADTVARALVELGNPSSVHAAGRKARGALERARAQVAAGAGARTDGVIFTSGGTEANNLALTGIAKANGVTRLIVSRIEHDAVLAPVKAGALPYDLIPVGTDGVVDEAVLMALVEAEVAKGGKPLVSVMLANNETGAVQPVARIAAKVREAGGLSHTDAVQALGKIPVDFLALCTDMMSLSAHKLGGPQGVGALVLRDGLASEPILRGGGQELGRRSGTENVAGIVGFGHAVEVAVAALDQAASLAPWRNGFEASLSERMGALGLGLRIFAEETTRLPNTSCFAVEGLKAETAVMALDLAGVAVSAGSACSSGKVTPSHVITAMGGEESQAAAAIRVSLGWRSQEQDLNRLLEALDTHLSRAAAPARAVG